MINTTTGLFGENAIKLLGSAPVGATIIGNEIDAAITGILVNGVDAPLIEGNIIEFYSPSGFISPGYGIHVLNAEDAQIAENQVTGNCSSGSCSNNVRGIKIDESPDFDADKNIIYDCSVAIWCQNAIDGCNLSCNEIHNSSKGILLLNIGSPTALIENPFSPGDPSDNGWYPESTAERVRTEKIGLGATCDADDIDWFYDDDESWSDIPIGLCVQGFGTLLPTFFLESGDYCDQPLRVSDLAEEFEYLEYYFQNWANRISEEGINNNLNDYYQAWNFWDVIKNNEELIESLTGTFEEAYSLILESNIPLFDSLRNLPGDRNKVIANEMNASIIPVNPIETILQSTNSIYYKTDQIQGIFHLSNESREELKEIANLSSFEFGYGVLNAWKMLDTIIDLELITEERIGNISVENNLILYPNPAIDYFYSEGNFEIGEVFEISILDLSGKIIMENLKTNIFQQNDVSKLPSGIYLIQAKRISGVTYYKNLVIFKPNN